MSLFIDASALVAVVTQENDWQALSAILESARSGLTSPLAIYEATLAIARKGDGDAEAAAQDLRDLLQSAGIDVIQIVAEDAPAALSAHKRYGKGRHPAALNMGDCFAYACARRLGVPLLYKGNDFALTDIRSALEA